MTWISTDTPEQNAVLERKFRTLGEMTLAMFADSGLRKTFWWVAYMTACVIIIYKDDAYSDMSWVDVSGGVCTWVSTPNLSRLDDWGARPMY